MVSSSNARRIERELKLISQMVSYKNWMSSGVICLVWLPEDQAVDVDEYDGGPDQVQAGNQQDERV
jgi:hypothetical protein